MCLNDFVILEKVGSGSFASVYKARRLIDQKIYALKKINLKALSQREKNNALNEIRLLACLKSPFIIGYCESFFDQKLDILCIAMEYADGGDLLKKIENHKKQKVLIAEIEIWKVFIHLLYGLNELHSRSILHRDLKSQNVFIAGQTYKIGDMNVSKIVKNGRLAQTQTGTPYYASPQVWNDQPYNEKSDIWSLGCILYELSALQPPFSAKSMEKLFEQVNQARIPRIPKNYSKQLQSLIDQCLQKNPFLRPTTQNLLSNQTVKNYENMLIKYKPNLDKHEKGNMLLQTIYMPASKKQLNDKLPQSNYKSSVQQRNEQNKQIVNKIEPVFSNIENLINQNKTERKTKNKSINKNSSRSKQRSRSKINSCKIFKGKQNKKIPSSKNNNIRENLIARAQMIFNSDKIDKAKTPPRQIENKILHNKVIITETVSKQLKPKKLIFEEQIKQKQDEILDEPQQNQQQKQKEPEVKKVSQDISKSPYLGETIRNLSNISVQTHEYYNFHVQKDEKNITQQMTKIDLALGFEKLNSFYSKFILKANIFFMNKIKRQGVIHRMVQGNQKEEKKRNRSRSIPRLEKPRQKNHEDLLDNFLLKKIGENNNLAMNQKLQIRQKENQTSSKYLPQYHQTDKKYIRQPLMDKNTYNILQSNQKSNKKMIPESIFSQGSIQLESNKKKLFQNIQASNNLVHSLNDKLDRLDLERRMKKYINV